MDSEDKRLGMDRPISRRDFLEGSVAVLGAAAAGSALAGTNTPNTVGMPTTSNPSPASNYPPIRAGLRGSHKGAFEAAHQLAWESRTDWGPAEEKDDPEYDLVIVGAGISGLSAAWFYRENYPDAKILILENHDDFGGHAKRNEFSVGDRTMLGYGGSQSLEAPSSYSKVAQRLLKALAVDIEGLADAYDQDFYKRHGLASSIYFDKPTYGEDKLLRSEFIDASLFLPLADSGVSPRDGVSAMPLQASAKKELLALLEDDQDRLPDHSIFSEPAYLASITYQQLLTRHLGVKDPVVLNLLKNLPASYFGHGGDIVPAIEALAFGLPGLQGTSLGNIEGLVRGLIKFTTEPYVYHFPDGNASVARLLVRQLIPEIAQGSTMQDVVTAGFDYSTLDHAASNVRIRLRSTVINVSQKNKKSVTVNYVQNGENKQVQAKGAVLACYNMAIPHLCPELPAPQKVALASLVKSPLVYTNVLLRQWRAFESMGVGMAFSPGCWHNMAMLDFPVSTAGYAFALNPDEPIVLHMNKSVAGPGVTPEEQSRSGRYELLGRTFETFERDIRRHLAGMLGAGDFDPARDISAITVNRWPHGYAWSPNSVFHPEYAADEAPNEIARKPFGRITIANSDAGARAYLDCAIDEAFRAVSELDV